MSLDPGEKIQKVPVDPVEETREGNWFCYHYQAVGRG